MFGYVIPCKMELKIKDYEKFKAYYCGLCKAIKSNYGNLPRFTLNYDMTFLAVLLDSLNSDMCTYKKEHCLVHPLRKKLILIENSPLKYAAFCNTTLAYFKLIDNVADDNSIKSKIFSKLLHVYVKSSPDKLLPHVKYIEEKLSTLYDLEKNPEGKSLDELSHPFADITGYIISSYTNDYYKDNLYWLGYNLGKWIYIIDAWDDLEKDMNKNKFNAINSVFNKNGLTYNKFYDKLEKRIDFTLVNCANQCLSCLDSLPLRKNEDLLYNILQYGLVEKMDKVFKRSEDKHGKSI